MRKFVKHVTRLLTRPPKKQTPLKVWGKPNFVTSHKDQTLYEARGRYFILLSGESPGFHMKPSRNEIWKLVAEAGWSYRSIERFEPFGITRELCEKYGVGRLDQDNFYLNSYGIHLLMNRIRKDKNK